MISRNFLVERLGFRFFGFVCNLRFEIWNLRPLVLAAMLLSVAAAAAAAETDAFRRKQQAQEKARALAGELVGAVLDIQLRQLEENGLQDRQIYKDIAAMKGNLGALMRADM